MDGICYGRTDIGVDVVHQGNADVSFTVEIYVGCEI